MDYIMKRILSLALCLMIFVVMLCSCSVTAEKEADIIKLTTEKTTYSTDTKTVTYTVHNAENTVISTGESYLEKYDNDTWIMVEVDVPVYASNIRIEPNESQELSLPVTDTDTIGKGKYRVCQELDVSETTGETKNFDLGDGEEYKVNQINPDTNQELTLYAEFTVE